MRNPDEATLQPMANPTKEPLLGSLYEHWPAAEPHQWLNRFVPFEFASEPFAPFRQNWQSEAGANAVQEKSRIVIAQHGPPG